MIRLLVTEKETRIKEGMKMMGLSDTVYHLSWFIIMVSHILLRISPIHSVTCHSQQRVTALLTYHYYLLLEA
jgi:hypothetical protein